MVETEKLTTPGQKIDRELHPNGEKKKELVILRGITTSQINQALKADNPYPARVFLKVERYPSDIPVFFRLIDFKENGELQRNWIRPKIKLGSLIECRGYFVPPKNGSDRQSFTTYYYKLLATPRDLQNKTILDQSKARFPYWKKLVHEYGQQVDYLTKEQELEKIKNYD